jgi:hypothetical protein
MITLEQRRAVREARQHANVHLQSRLADVLCFLVPASQALTLKFLGVIPGGELLALPLLPILLVARGVQLWDRRLRSLLGLIGFWLVSQIVADLIHHISPTDMAKGTAAIIFFGIDIAFLFLLINRQERRVIIFGIGTIVGAALYIYLSPGHVAVPDGTFAVNWKFGYTSVFTPMTMLTASYFFRRKNISIVFAIILVITCVNLMYNARSAAAMAFVSGILVLPLFAVQSPKGSRGVTTGVAENNRAAFKRLIVIVGLTAAAALILGQAYSFTASHGLLGDDAQIKYEAQSKGKYGVLVGGRPEVLFEGQAVLESPFIGHGSYARDPKYAALLRELLIDAGYQEEGPEAETQGEDPDRIPTHSYLMQAWVWAGIGGAAIWLYALWISVKAIMGLVGMRLYRSPFYAHQIVGFVWSVLFSPFGQDARIGSAFVLVIVDVVLHLSEGGASRGTSAVGIQRLSDPRVRHAVVGVAPGFRPRWR